MGKTKGEAARSKSRPSSSSLAASLSQGAGAVSTGFGGYIGSTRVDSAGPSEDAFYQNIDGETAANLRRLSKKDPITKLKALSALTNYFQEHSAAEVSPLLSCWVFEYKKLVQDNSRQVREAAQKAMCSLVSTVGRSLAPHLRSVMGAWWMAHFDPFYEVSDAAKQAFLVAFPGPKKRLEALIFCANDILTNIDENLKLTPQTISEKSTPLEESTEKLELVVSSSLFSLSAILNILFTGSPSDSNEKIVSAAVQLFKDHKMFQGLMKSGPRVRTAVYEILRAYTQYVPQVFSSENLDPAIKLILGAFLEKDTGCHQAMWDMILVFSQRFGQGWAAKKIVHQRFWAFLRHGCYGSQKISYPCLLPLFSLIPASAIAPARDFLLQFYGNLWKGLEEGPWTREDGVLLLNVSKECFMWLAEHEERFSSVEGFPEGSLKSSLVDSVLFDVFWGTYMDEASDRSFFPAEEIGSCIVEVMNLLDDELLAGFFLKLREDCLASLLMNNGYKNARMLQFFLKVAPLDSRARVLNSVLKPFVAKGFDHIKTTEGPEALKLLSGLVSAYGPAVFDSLASLNWRGAESSEEIEEKTPESLSEIFNSKHLEYLFRTQLLPWCTSESNELKVQILMGLLESETLSKEWEYVLASVTESEDSEYLNTLSIIINTLQKRDGVENLERWHSKKIDQKVLSIASESKLLDSSCYNLIRAALEGVFHNGKHHFLLSKETLLDVMKKLLRTMLQALELSKDRSLLLLATSIVPWAFSERDSSKASFIASRSAFDLLLPCHQALFRVEVEGSSEALETFVAGFFCLRWAFGPTDEHDDEAESESMELETEDEEQGALMISLMRARQTLNSLCREIPSRLKLQEMMISGVKKVLPEAPEPEPPAKWILDILSSACGNEDEKQKALDLLLSGTTDYWPLWSIERPVSDQTQMQQHKFFSSVVHKVGRSLGEETLFLGDGARSRPDVILELLCEWKWDGGSAEDFVLPFLQSCGRSEAHRGVLDKVFEDLFSRAADAPAGDANFNKPFVRGLLGVLRALFGHAGPFQREDGEKVFSSFVPGLPMSVLPQVLEVLMPALLKGSSSGIDVESPVCEWLTAALNGPSLYSSSPDDMRLMEVAVACFPLEISGGAAALLAASKADVSQTRRNYLLFLLRKHIHSSDRFGGEFQPAVHLLLARLISAAAAYCWSSFGMEEWAFITGKIKEWILDGVLNAEETAESLGDGSSELKLPDEHSMKLLATALNIFQLMQALRSMEEGSGTSSMNSLDECQWQGFESRALESVLRLFLATGLAEAVSSGNESIRDQVAVRRLEQTFLWDRVAEIALGSPARVREAAVRAADLWGLGKSSISALYTLLFSPHGLPSLQWVSYRFLLTDPLQHQAVSCNPVSSSKTEDDQAQLDLHLESASDDIRPELLAVLNTRGSVLLGSGVSSTLLGHYYLAWSIFLSYLRTLETSSLVRQRLLQYVKDYDLATTLLDCLVRHFPLKKSLGEKKGGTPSDPSPVAEAAKRAASTGSVFFAAEGLLWSGKVTEFGAIAGALYSLLLRVLPACVQTWFSGLRDRATAAATEVFTAENCSLYLLTEEFNQVQAAAVSEEYLTIKPNRGLREVAAVYKKEEVEMDIVLRLPSCYPLKAVEVDSTKWFGKSETRVRKWLLSMSAFLRNQNGSLYDAVLLWKRNVDREFEGVEECPICYSIIHTTHHCLPRLACKTCKHKFHGACLYKWFSSSHKSTCPLCQTPF